MIGGAWSSGGGPDPATAGGDETSGAYLAGAALFAGAAASQFLVKSRPEKISRSYLEESRVKPSPRWLSAWGPAGHSSSA